MSKVRFASFLVLMSCILLCIQNCASKAGGFTKGEEIYTKKCANCHMADGSGLGSYIPPLKKDTPIDFITSTCIITLGKGEENLQMPAFKELTDVELTNLVNYLNFSLGNTKVYLPKQLGEVRGKCVE